MMISGFTFVRNAIRFDFPVIESIRSLLPLCDELVVAVGDSDDGTLDLIRGIGDPKLRIVETVWDDSLREGGRVLAQQTDIALAECRGDWCIYLQADEVLHEDDHRNIVDQIERADADPRVEALLLRYLHFYGSYDYVGAGRQWYRQEIRIVRNTGRVVSWGDAQGFRRLADDGSAVKLRARRIDARVFHYGWVKHPAVQLEKVRHTSRFWHDDEWIEREIPDADLFDYDSAHELRRFTGTHPALMRERIESSREWARHFDPSRLKSKTFAMRVVDGIERISGVRIGEYRNFTEVR